MRITQRVIATGAAVAACVAAAISMAYASDASNGTATTVDFQAPYAVENFNYPGAEKISADLGIVLKRGDGHITLADCGSDAGLMEVFSRTKGRICFRVTGKTGYLSVEIPAVYGMKSDAAHKSDVKLIAEGSEQNISLAANQWQGVGESQDPQRRDHVLVEIRTSL